MLQRINMELEKIRIKKPLILNFTNMVTMEFVANALLSLGAAPLMSVSEQEVEDLVSLAHGVCVNIGTLDERFVECCLSAAQMAQALGKPFILDPVGAGASRLRTQAALRLLPYANVVRGNATEILALSGIAVESLGAESVHRPQEARETAVQVARKVGCVVVVSGSQDWVTDGSQEESVEFGSPVMSLVTGMGCALSAGIAAFMAVNGEAFSSALWATSYFGLCGQYAARKAAHPGYFRAAFTDALHQGLRAQSDEFSHIFYNCFDARVK